MLFLFPFHAHLKQKAGDPPALRYTQYFSVRPLYIFSANVFFLINEVI
jgi:hypothetical protein